MNDVRRHAKYERLIETARALEKAPTSVAYPCDESSLRGAVEAQHTGLLTAILVGPKARIHEVARRAKIDISGIELLETEDSEAAAAAAAVRLASEGRAQMLMKGSLHTDQIMGAVVKREAGLRTSRRVSHCFVMDVPAIDRVVIITDAAINIFPTLEDKVDIVQNAIDLCHALGREKPLVAILSAMETVNPKVPSTIEAAALCKMAERGQITGAILDGPLALDNAIDLVAARIKKIDSPVAGKADVLVVPDLEAGNMLAKSLTFMADADAAGIVLGARVPVILTSRADSVTTRLASCAVAALVAHARRRDLLKAVA
jgi:phosphate acetyltransferase